MEVKEIQQLLQLFQASDLTHFKYQHGQDSVIFDRKVDTKVPAKSATKAPAEASAGQGTVIKAALVGTFYAGTSPDAAPLVKVGDQVAVGTQVGVIEAMKMVNAVQSTVAGTVKRILVKDGEKVEYDQPIIELTATH